MDHWRVGLAGDVLAGDGLESGIAIQCVHAGDSGLPAAQAEQVCVSCQDLVCMQCDQGSHPSITEGWTRGTVPGQLVAPGGIGASGAGCDDDEGAGNPMILAMVGDSITAGYAASSPDQSYPSQLQGILDPALYDVRNEGVSGRTMLKTGMNHHELQDGTFTDLDASYWDEHQYTDTLEMGLTDRDAIVLMLGTNDAKQPLNWNHDEFYADYTEMVRIFQGLVGPNLFVMIPPPLYFGPDTEHWPNNPFPDRHWQMNQTLINVVFPTALRTFFMDDLDIPADHIIDLFEPFGGRALSTPELLADGCHPNDAGYGMLAQIVHDAVMPFISSPLNLPPEICVPTAPSPAAAGPCVDDPDGALQAAVGLSCEEAIAAVPAVPGFSGNACDFDLVAWLQEDMRVADVCPASCGTCSGRRLQNAGEQEGEQEGCVAITGRMQQLKPLLGCCYTSDPELRDAVILWRQRASHEALELAGRVDSLAARHLAINIAQMHDMYDVIDENADAILAQEPGDPHALFVKALYAHAAGDTEQYHTYAGRLRESPAAHVAAALDRVTADVVLAWTGYDTMRTTVDVVELARSWQPDNLALVIFGCPILPDGTPSPPLQDRLDAALALAAAFPNAVIIASGGAVSSEYTESEGMRDWLVAHGVATGRIVVDTHARDTLGNAEFVAAMLKERMLGNVVLDTSTFHAIRSRLTLEGVLTTRGVGATIVGFGAGNSGTWHGDDHWPLGGQERLELEQKASHRDVARARGLFGACDF